LTEERRRGWLFRLGAALRGDQRAELLDEFCSRGIVLQRVDEPLEFIGRDRCGLCRSRRLGRSRPRR